MGETDRGFVFIYLFSAAELSHARIIRLKTQPLVSMYLFVRACDCVRFFYVCVCICGSFTVRRLRFWTIINLSTYLRRLSACHY